MTAEIVTKHVYTAVSTSMSWAMDTGSTFKIELDSHADK